MKCPFCLTCVVGKKVMLGADTQMEQFTPHFSLVYFDQDELTVAERLVLQCKMSCKPPFHPIHDFASIPSMWLVPKADLLNGRFLPRFLCLIRKRKLDPMTVRSNTPGVARDWLCSYVVEVCVVSFGRKDLRLSKQKIRRIWSLVVSSKPRRINYLYLLYRIWEAVLLENIVVYC